MVDHQKAYDMPLLPLEFFSRPAAVVAPALIGCYLFTEIGGTRTGGMIIETESYEMKIQADGHEMTDPFIHCHPSGSPSKLRESKPMLFAPGNAYIYDSNGPLCLNFTTNSEGIGSAVLINPLTLTHETPPTLNQRRSLFDASMSELKL
jgi:DNA-3-methyladenine glycosylase